MKIAGINFCTGEGLVIEGVTMKNAYPIIAKRIADDGDNIKHWNFAIGSDNTNDHELFYEIREFRKVPSYKIGKD